jgi:16S rRNA (guanine(966)-N(2))-methyltransferase RsmD
MWVLDLCAGAGGLGLEALSRGAAGAHFVEQNPRALQILRRNVEELHFTESTLIQKADVRRLVLRGFPRKYGWIFFDPPYKADLYEPVLSGLAQNLPLEATGTLIVEHDRRQAPAQSAGCLIRTDHRQYGDTAVSFYRLKEEP